MSFTYREKEILDELILLALERRGTWLHAGEVASEIRREARKRGIGGTLGPNDAEVGYRLRSMRKRGQVRNRPTESPYMAGNYQWALAP